MKKFLFVCAMAVSGLFSSVASAQDFCCPTQYNECCNEIGSFEGIYIGANLGAFSDTFYRNDFSGFIVTPSGHSTISTDVTVGLQLGYDWMWNSSVVGLVADWSWVNTSNHYFIAPGITEAGHHNNNNWYTTIRARAGLTLCDALLYITGGAAVSRFDTTYTNAVASLSDNHTRWGWVGGFGAEYLVWCKWSFGAEFLFLQFDNRTSTLSSGGVAYAFGQSDAIWVGRFVMNYRFGDLCGCFW